MEKLLRTLLNRITEPVMVLNQEGKCQFLNAALGSYLGLSAGDRQPEEVDRKWPELQGMRLGEGEVLINYTRGDGGTVRVKLLLLPIDGGMWSAWLLSESEMQRTLIDFHAERLQTLGMLAGGVAHDFNNILAGILGHTTYLKTVLSSDGHHVESLNSIEEGAKRASAIIQQILNFSRLNAEEKLARCDLSAIVSRTCALLRGAISPDFTIRCELPADKLLLLGVEAKIAQVLVNLVINSRDASPPGSEIVVRVAQGYPRGITGGESGAPFAVLEVTDSGSGMSQEVLERAFEPYFSTKRERGTGLGLATVHAIVELLGGVIEVVSQVGGAKGVTSGTTISVFFPLIEADGGVRGAIEIDESRPLPSLGGERILVVDDEFPVRNVLSLSLDHLGYQVSISSSGIEAIEKVTADPRAFDLVILDMLMPNLSGDEVFFRLKAIRPDIRVLVISGYSSEDAVRSILENGGMDFLPKPFTIGELSKKVRSSLERPLPTSENAPALEALS